MNNIDVLLKAVCNNPSDHERRLVLADAFEEEGQLENARCQRWLAHNRRYAYKDNKGLYCWLRKNDTYDQYCYLPVLLFNALEKYLNNNHIHLWRDYETRLDAELAVMAAFQKALTEGQNPDE